MLSHIQIIRNDGKDPAIYNAYFHCLTIESQIRRAMQNENLYPIGPLADVWIDSTPDHGVLIYDIDKLISIRRSMSDSPGWIRAFEYHGGTLFFTIQMENEMIARLNGIKNRLHSDFGRAYLENLLPA